MTEGSEKVFQSLIGRLKTLLSINTVSIGTVFQSLIGRLKTFGVSLRGGLSYQVSIPHR